MPSSLHARALSYANARTNSSSSSKTSIDPLLAEISTTLQSPHLNATKKEAIRTTCETLATTFHTPPLARMQLLLWAAKSQPSTMSGPVWLQACRTRLEFARFWGSILEEECHQRGVEPSAELKWLEYDVRMFRERLNEMTVGVMVREVLGERGGGQVKERIEIEGDKEGRVGRGSEMPDPEFSERMLEHPIFSLEYAMWQDWEESRRGREGARGE